MSKSKKRVAVLYGGWNSEREVSLKSGQASYDALIKLGYDAVKIDFGRDIVDRLKEVKPDVVFNALHGQYGEDGRIQGLLDILNIPYTHSGIIASAISMDKILTKNICSAYGVLSPKFAVIKKGDDQNNKRILFEEIGKPFVIKPVFEGSSVGVQVILQNMPFDYESFDWKYGNEMIVEKYIAGQEVQVAIMDNKALGVIEVRPKKLFYDYECKYTPGMTEYVMPAQIPAEKYDEIMDLALRCHKVVGCSGVSRIDFIYNSKDGGDNNFYFLEINTHPGFTPLSLVPKIAAYVGISFEQIVEYLVSNAKCGTS